MVTTGGREEKDCTGQALAGWEENQHGHGGTFRDKSVRILNIAEKEYF